MLKKPLVMLAVLISALYLGTAACEPEEEEVEKVDEQDLVAVNHYVEEMTAVLLDETLKADLKGWVRDPHCADVLPLSYDEERRKWLQEHKKNIEVIKKRHLGRDFPGLDEIVEWEVIIVRGDRQWKLDGREWVEALDKLDALAAEITGTIAMIIEAEGELDMSQSERVLELIGSIEPVVEEVRTAIFRE